MDEKKHISKKKKLTIVISVVLVLAVACAGGAWWYVADKNAKEAAVRQERYDEAKNKFDSLNTNIDEKKGVEYIQYINQGDKAGALDVYRTALGKAEDSDQKLLVLSDLSTIANYTKEYDHLLYAAQERLKLNKSIESYYSLVIAYTSLGDYEAVVKTYEELLDDYDALAATSDSPDDAMQDKQSYQDELDGARELIQIRKEANDQQ